MKNAINTFFEIGSFSLFIGLCVLLILKIFERKD